MTTASELADDLERLIAAGTSRSPWLWENAPRLLSALRRVDGLTGALEEIVEIGDEAKRQEALDDFDRGSRAARGEAADIARAALTGEAR